MVPHPSAEAGQLGGGNSDDSSNLDHHPTLATTTTHICGPPKKRFPFAVNNSPPTTNNNNNTASSHSQQLGQDEADSLSSDPVIQNLEQMLQQQATIDPPSKRRRVSFEQPQQGSMIDSQGAAAGSVLQRGLSGKETVTQQQRPQHRLFLGHNSSNDDHTAFQASTPNIGSEQVGQLTAAATTQGSALGVAAIRKSNTRVPPLPDGEENQLVQPKASFLPPPPSPNRKAKNSLKSALLQLQKKKRARDGTQVAVEKVSTTTVVETTVTAKSSTAAAPKSPPQSPPKKKRRSRRSIFDDVKINGDGFLADRQLAKDPKALLEEDALELVNDLQQWCHEQRTRGWNLTKDNKIVMTRGACEEKVLEWRAVALRDQGFNIKLDTGKAGKPVQEQPRVAHTIPEKEVSTTATTSHMKAAAGPPDDKHCMPLVPSLSKRFIDPTTGMAAYKFAVRNSDSPDLIYDFRVDAGDSGIRFAGNGAFLTFLGARRLTKEDQTSQESGRLLEARDSYGRRCKIRVTGEGLEEDCEDEYVATSLPPLYDPKNTPILVEDTDAYEEIDSATFSSYDSGCSWIDLGRYAPFLPSDRKYQSSFDIKNFVWSGMPSEYGFDMKEPLDERDCVADISDDFTGKPHAVARQNIAMAVNETGGAPSLNQTVWSEEILEQGVHYYFHTHFAGRLKKGQQIEIFICYSDTYTDIRERKGYGKRTPGVKSDDHFSSYLERQLVDRFNMVEEIYNEIQDTVELYALTELMVKIHDELSARMSSFLRKFLQGKGKGIDQVPDVHQITALRRLDWFRPFLLQKIDFMVKHMHKVCSYHPMWLLNQCKANTDNLEWASWPALVQGLENKPSLVDSQGRNLLATLRKEATEEVCFENPSLLFACNEDTWCGVARELTQDMCLAVFKEKCNNDQESQITNLLTAFTSLASKAAESIRSPSDLQQLMFSRDCWKRYPSIYNVETLKDRPKKAMCVFTYNNLSELDDAFRHPEAIVVNERTSEANVLRRIHQDWYLCRQVIVILQILAKKYLGALESSALTIVCRNCHISADTVRRYAQEKLTPEKHVGSLHYFYGNDFETIYQYGNQLKLPSEKKVPTPRKRKVASTGTSKREGEKSFNKLLFWKILVEGLKKMGWTVEKGNRVGDWYLCPPGVTRGKGFKPRVDFFDSIKLVRRILEHDKRFCEKAEIISLVKETKKLGKVMRRLKDLKEHIPKDGSGKELKAYLKMKAEQLSSS